MSRFLAALVLLAACGVSEPDPGPLGPPDADAIELFPGCDASAPTRDIPPEARDSILARVANEWRTIDDDWAAIARELPGGFGGFWRDDGGRLVIALVDPAQAAVVREAINERDPGLTIPSDAPIVRVRWSFAQLWEWDRYVSDVVGRVDGVAWTDRDEVRNRVVIALVSNGARDTLAAELLARDVPCGLFVLEIGEMPVAL